MKIQLPALLLTPYGLEPMPILWISKKQLDNYGIETSVRPNPTIVLSNLRSRFAAKKNNRQDGREPNHQRGCAGGESLGRAGA